MLKWEMIIQEKVQQGTFSKEVLKDTCGSSVIHQCSTTKAVSECLRVLRRLGGKNGAVQTERRREGMGYSEDERCEQY